MLLSSTIAAAIALGAAFVFAALMEPGPVLLIVGTMTAGVLWGVTTKVLSKLLGSETVTVVLQSNPIQQSYRKTIKHYIGAVLDDVTMSILTNTPFDQQNSVYFDVCDEYRFEDKERHMFFKYIFKVLPEPGTLPRSVDEGIPPLDLPTYDPSSTHTTQDEKPTTTTDMISSIRQGTLLGLTSGASASLMSLLLGTAGVILGVVFATMLARHIAPPKSPEKAALVKEFATELKRHADRLMYCAKDNNIGLEAEIYVAWMSAGVWRSKSVQVNTMAYVNRSLSGRLVWADEMVERGVRTRRERKSIADGTLSLECYRTD
ncbi:hypothetical protein V8C26DRAFT_423392 [Trichoderma gracile]